jgi:hypothetical protein
VAPSAGTLAFAGFTWLVKDSGGGRVGPGDNVFAADGVWTDNGGLHLTYAARGGACGRGDWRASEVELDHTLGYGTYLVSFVGPFDACDPWIVWSNLFLWDHTGNAGNGYREVDFEVARWGDPGDATCAQFVLTPLANALPPGWKVRYNGAGRPGVPGVPAGAAAGCAFSGGSLDFGDTPVAATTCVLRWFAGELTWRCFEGLLTLAELPAVPADRLLAAYTYASPARVPDAAGDSRPHINLWHVTGGAPSNGRAVHTITARWRAARARGGRAPNR